MPVDMALTSSQLISLLILIMMAARLSLPLFCSQETTKLVSED